MGSGRGAGVASEPANDFPSGDVFVGLLWSATQPGWLPVRVYAGVTGQKPQLLKSGLLAAQDGADELLHLRSEFGALQLFIQS
jgi:hypothetical protein